MPATAKKPLASQTYMERSFQLPDLNEKGDWLVARLKERFQSSDGELVNWLRSVIVQGSNEFLFVRTDHAFALAQSVREPMMSGCVVSEQFVLSEKGFEDEGAYLYSVLYQWAKNLGACEMRIENLTNIPRDDIKARIGGLWAREQVYSKMDS
jgi:hypothetical protein